jgi:hypothetical protein
MIVLFYKLKTINHGQVNMNKEKTLFISVTGGTALSGGPGRTLGLWGC